MNDLTRRLILALGQKAEMAYYDPKFLYISGTFLRFITVRH